MGWLGSLQSFWLFYLPHPPRRNGGWAVAALEPRRPVLFGSARCGGARRRRGSPSPPALGNPEAGVRRTAVSAVGTVREPRNSFTRRGIGRQRLVCDGRCGWSFTYYRHQFTFYFICLISNPWKVAYSHLCRKNADVCNQRKQAYK